VTPNFLALGEAPARLEQAWDGLPRSIK
jgi:hypothetical protein